MLNNYQSFYLLVSKKYTMIIRIIIVIIIARSYHARV